MAWRCARAAISGTTPPKRACSSMLDASASPSSTPSSTKPTPVSSQDVSIPITIVTGSIVPGSVTRPDRLQLVQHRLDRAHPDGQVALAVEQVRGDTGDLLGQPLAVRVRHH